MGAMERHGGNTAYVHADRRQGAPGAHADTESLVEHCILPHGARPYHFGYAGRSRVVARHRIRPSVSRGWSAARAAAKSQDSAPARFGGAISWGIHQSTGLSLRIRED